MAGHSHWKQIKVQKGSADQKRAVLFSKLLRAVSVAATVEPNPQFNPRLRTAIEKARAANVPGENLERAITKAREQGPLEEVRMEAYGPGGAAILIHAITPSKNRTVNEVKLLLKERGGKWAEPGSVRWAFDEVREGGLEWRAKFPQALARRAMEELNKLIQVLEEHPDIDVVATNVTPP